MQVLRVVTELTGAENGGTLAAIAQLVNWGRRPPISGNWVYKCLQSLQEKELLNVDLLRRPSVYRTDSSILENGVLELIRERLRQLEDERKKLEDEVSLLRSASPQEMAQLLIVSLSGRPPEHSREILMGSGRVMDVVSRQVNLGAVEGSIVRIMQGLEAIVDIRLSFTGFEQSVLDAISRGATVRAILFPHESQETPEEGLVRFMGAVGPRLVHALESGRLSLRVLTGPKNTYRMLSVDEHTMIMFLSAAYIPDAAVLLRSVDDVGLIDDAIRTFDERWKTAREMNESILSLLRSNDPAAERA